VTAVTAEAWGAICPRAGSSASIGEGPLLGIVIALGSARSVFRSDRVLSGGSENEFRAEALGCRMVTSRTVASVVAALAATWI
jgi:hypothetical protein